MKTILLFIMVLAAAPISAQETYKVTEGELQFIHPEKGVVLKKDGRFYIFSLMAYETKDSTYLKPNMELIPEDSLQKTRVDARIIYASEITTLNKKQLKKTKFRETYHRIEYEFSRFNSGYLALSTKTLDEDGWPAEPTVYPYFILSFLNGSQVVSTDSNYGNPSFIIHTEKKWKGIMNCRQDSFHYNNITLDDFKVETGTIKRSAEEIYRFQRQIDNNYEIDTLPDKQVRLINNFKRDVLGKSYDSISIAPLIACYRGKNIDVYNYSFEKLRFDNLKAIFANRDYLPTAQILENNEIRKTDLKGEDKFLKFANSNDSGDWMGPPYTDTFLTNENNTFYLQFSDDIFYNGKQIYSMVKIMLPLPKNVENLYFRSNGPNGSFENEIGNIPNDLYVYGKMNDGKYSLFNIYNLLVDTEKKTSNDYIVLDKLDYISGSISADFDKVIFKFSKDGLWGYFPFNRKSKYKDLEDFKENFARFEMPDGQLGLLDINGEEYFDE